MRRFILPLILLAGVIASFTLTSRADSASDPGHAVESASVSNSAGTPLLSVRRTPGWLRRPTADTMLGRSIQSVLANPAMPVSRCVSVHRDGVDVAKNQVGDLFTSGPLQRLITAASATETLSADTVFRTEAAIQKNVEVSDTGVLDGDIWLVGGGDPLLATADYAHRLDRSRAFTDLEDLADQVAGKLASDGVVGITGAVFGDESKYAPPERDYIDEETPVGPVWTQKDNADNRIGPLSALQVNEGFTAWPEPGDPSQNVRSKDPATDAANIFAQLLTDRGIDIAGASGNSVAPQGAERRVLGDVESIPFADILGLAIAPEGATISEMLLKEIGVRSGVTALRFNAILFGEAALLDKAGIPSAGTVIADGSGLSTLNQTSCDFLISILDNSADLSPLLEAIPDVEDGPLAGCTEPLGGQLRVLATAEADTSGTVGSYIAANGDRVTFAMIVNGPELGAQLGPCNDLQTAMVTAITGHPYGPTLEELSPLSAVSG